MTRLTPGRLWFLEQASLNLHAPVFWKNGQIGLFGLVSKLFFSCSGTSPPFFTKLSICSLTSSCCLKISSACFSFCSLISLSLCCSRSHSSLIASFCFSLSCRVFSSFICSSCHCFCAISSTRSHSASRSAANRASSCSWNSSTLFCSSSHVKYDGDCWRWRRSKAKQTYKIIKNTSIVCITFFFLFVFCFG